MEKLRIDKPCQENWNEFTPKPEGGFCGSCAKIVIDFTNKTNHQIKAILEAKQNDSICGRIGVAQLENYNLSMADWQISNHPKVVQSRFLWALLLAFGFALFSATTINAQTTMGKMMVQTETNSDSSKKAVHEMSPPAKLDSLYNHEMIMGDMIIEPLISNDTILEDTMASTSKIINQKTETLECKELPLKIKLTVPQYPVIMGTMIAPDLPPHKMDSKIVQDSVTIKTIKESDHNELKAELHPNPALTHTMLKLTIYKTAQYDIIVYNSAGKNCQSFLNQPLEPGIHHFKIDSELLKKGVYLISISSVSHQSALRLIKN